MGLLVHWMGLLVVAQWASLVHWVGLLVPEWMVQPVLLDWMGLLVADWMGLLVPDWMGLLVRDWMGLLVPDWMGPLVHDWMGPLVPDWMDPLVPDWMGLLELDTEWASRVSRRDIAPSIPSLWPHSFRLLLFLVSIPQTADESLWAPEFAQPGFYLPSWAAV